MSDLLIVLLNLLALGINANNLKRSDTFGEFIFYTILIMISTFLIFDNFLYELIKTI